MVRVVGSIELTNPLCNILPNLYNAMWTRHCLRVLGYRRACSKIHPSSRTGSGTQLTRSTKQHQLFFDRRSALLHQDLSSALTHQHSRESVSSLSLVKSDMLVRMCRQGIQSFLELSLLTEQSPLPASRISLLFSQILPHPQLISILPQSSSLPISRSIPTSLFACGSVESTPFSSSYSQKDQSPDTFHHTFGSPY